MVVTVYEKLKLYLTYRSEDEPHDQRYGGRHICVLIANEIKTWPIKRLIMRANGDVCRFVLR